MESSSGERKPEKRFQAVTLPFGETGSMKYYPTCSKQWTRNRTKKICNVYQGHCPEKTHYPLKVKVEPSPWQMWSPFFEEKQRGQVYVYYKGEYTSEQCAIT